MSSLVNIDCVGTNRPYLVLTQASQWLGWAAGMRNLSHACTAQCEGNYYLRTVLQHLHLKQRRMVLPGEDEDEDEGIDLSVGRRIFSSFSSFQSLPLCSCVSVCWFFLLTLYSPWFPLLFVFSAFFSVFCFFSPCPFSGYSLAFYRGSTNWSFPSTPLLSLAEDKSCGDLDLGFNPYLPRCLSPCGDTL